MGLFDNFFTSPRERKAKDLYGGELQGYDQLVSDAGNLQGANADVTGLPSLREKFGLKPHTAADVSRAYNPARANLATRLAQMRSSAASRLRGANATPGVSFAPIDAYGGQAFADLEGRAASEGLQTEIGDERYGADMLDRILRGNEDFGFRKQGAQLQARAAKGGAMANYLGSLSGDSTFDDILGLVSSGAKAYGAAQGVK